MKAAIAPDGDVHTPYGATEALPVASIAASEVLAETAAKSATGAGTCVGRHFPGIEWKVIRITDEPIATIDEAEELPPGEIGELIVRGPVVTTEYVTRTECQRAAQDSRRRDVLAPDGRRGLSWTRVARDRFWFCGRKSHRVITPSGTLFTIPCEAIFNQHPLDLSLGPRRRRPARAAAAGDIRRAWPEHRATASRAVDEAQADELRELAAQHTLTRPKSHDFFLMDGSFPSISATTPRSSAKNWPSSAEQKVGLRLTSRHSSLQAATAKLASTLCLLSPDSCPLCRP